MPETMTLHEALTAAVERGARVRPCCWREPPWNRLWLVFSPTERLLLGGPGADEVEYDPDLRMRSELLGLWEEHADG